MKTKQNMLFAQWFSGAYLKLIINKSQMNDLGNHNTFSKPPVFTQIIAYAIIITSFLIYSISIQTHFLSTSLRIILNVLYYSTFTGLLITAAVTSCTDPSDKMLQIEKDNLQKHNLSNAFYCQICRGIVAQKTRHCKICDICVSGFDHHCIWINNCIGKENYKVFIAMLLFVNANFILFQVSILLLWLQSSWANYLPSMIANWAFALVLLVFLLLILALTLFHFFLIFNDRTTYEHIVMQKKPIIAPDNSRKSQGEAQMEAQRQDNSVTKLVTTFKTETQLVSVQNVSQEQPRKVKDIMIFQAESQQQSNHSQSKPEERANQIKSVKISSKKSQEEQSSRSQASAQSKLFMRNKSLNYIIGQLAFEQPHKIGYSSEVIKQQRSKVYIQDNKPHQR